MRVYKLHENKQSNKAIVFFGGFAFLPEAYVLNSEVSVYALYDYESLECDLSFCKEYEQIILIAYSMGVMIASRVDLSSLKISKAIAICGSPLGIDKLSGIDPRAFMATARAFNAGAFLANCGCDEGYLNKLNANPKSELNALIKHARLPLNDLEFHKAYIANDDLIFRPSALEIAFKTAQIVRIKAPHFCFKYFKSWQDFE